MNIAILGAYQTKFGELWDKSLDDLIVEAASQALCDAGIDRKYVQICFFGNKLAPQVTDQNHTGALVAQLLGMNVPVIRVEAACASGGVAVSQACLAIASGQYDLALVVGAEKMTDLGPAQIASALMGAASAAERQSGLSFVGLYALMAQKYLDQFGACQEDLACVSVKNHYHASFNPKAQFRNPITVDQVMHSGAVAEPLKTLDCSPISDGAAAVVLASPKYAKKIHSHPVRIVASRQVNNSLSLDKRPSLVQLDATVQAANMAFAAADMERKDISLAEVHDCFTIAEILALEDLGFYRKGEGYVVARNGELKLGGKRPINLSGGLKACGHPVGATGVKQIVELYNQLSGRAGTRQAQNIKAGLAHNVGGTGGTAVVHILKK